MHSMTKFALGTAVALVIAVPNMSFASPANDEQSREVSDFTKVKLMSSMDVDVVVGKKTSVKVIAPEDLLEKIITEVDGDTLKVHYERKMKWDRAWNNKEIRIMVTTPSIDGAGVYGSGDLNVKGGKGKELDLSVKGSGDVVMNKSDYKSVDISLMGSGDINIDGKCDHISVGIMGSGDVSAGKLKCSDADVKVKGSGDVEVYASKSVEASVYGSGDISVLGKPKEVDRTERGSGDIHIRR